MSFFKVLEHGRQRDKALKTYLAIIAVIFGCLPLLVTSSWLLHILIMVMLFAMLSSAWNILGGYCGQFSVGHASFFGIAGYSMGIIILQYKGSIIVGLLAGAFFSVALAFIIGLSSLRLTGIFFALTTFALAEILRKLALFHESLTGGPLGMSVQTLNISRSEYYYISLGLMFFTLIVTIFFERTRFGISCQAIKEDEEAATSSGINTGKVKIKAAMLSAFLTALGGAFYALYIGVLEPDVVFSFNLSIKIIIVTVIGGIGTILGPLLGAFIVIVPDELIRGLLGGTYAGLSGILYGVLLIVVIMLRPQGLRGFLEFVIPQKKD